MSKRILVVFTFRSVERMLEEGGSQSWALNPANARRCSYIVCTRNRQRAGASQEGEHGAAFLVGRISSIDPAPEGESRYIIRFDRYALLDPQPIVWPGARNPIWYVDDFDDLKIDEAALEWLPVPEAVSPKKVAEAAVPSGPAASPKRLTIAEAKAALAATFGVDPDNIEITVRG